MNQIEWRANSSKQLVAFENSKPLSDFENPQEQALAWVKGIEVEPQTEAICMVGCGSGYQLEVLQKTFPNLKIFVIESRPAIIGFFSKQFRNVEFVYIEKIENLKNVENLSYLLSAKVEKKLFQPGIGFQAELLEEVYWFLNLRTYEALSFHLNKKIEGPAQVLIGAKQFLQHVDSEYKDYKLSELLTIRELLK